MIRPHPRRSLSALLFTVAACGGDSSTNPRQLPAGLTQLWGVETGEVGVPLTEPPRVKVTDARGTVLSGVTIAWTPAAGSVATATSQTGENGIAEIEWTLGTVAGSQRLTASIAGEPDVSSVHFEGIAAAGPSTGVVVQPQHVTLQPLESVSLTAEVLPDRYGNPVSTAVVWSTSDDVSAPITSDGRVRGGRAGRSILRATAGSVTAETTVEVAAAWKSIGTGVEHSCALDALGYAFCWGSNHALQLGVPGVTHDSIPMPVGGGRRFESLVVGWLHACGVTSDRSVYCWGSNSSGQLGIGSLSRDDVATPTLVAGGISFASLTSNGVHACGIGPAGNAYCWGWESDGMLGNGALHTFAVQPAPVPVLGGRTYASIAGGGSHTCAITAAGETYCWGSNYHGQVGDGVAGGNRATPTLVNGGHTMASVTAGGSHSCALNVHGRAWCWGSNEMGQVGDGTFLWRPTPAAVSTPVDLATLSAGSRHTCALTVGGQAFCWGLNETGQLGDGTKLRQGSPTPVASDLRFTTMSAGQAHSCAITSEGRAYCWGGNHIGQLGTGTFEQRLTPAPVAAP